MRSGSPRPYAGGGFTLIELLITIGVVGILAAIVIIAINPQKQIEDARDAQRRADLNTILNAVYQFQIEEWRLPQRGTPPAAQTDILLGKENKLEICALSSTFICVQSPRKAYLYELVQFEYLTAIPQDPEDTDPKGTGYEIWRDEDGRIYVQAPNFRNGEGEGLILSK